MPKEFTWDVRLRDNALTTDDRRDCVAEVYLRGDTCGNRDVAEMICERGSEYRPETIENILNMRDAAVRRLIQQERSFRDGVVRLTPRVTGAWSGAEAKFDPAVNRLTVDAVPVPELRAALDAVAVRVQSVRPVGARIDVVTDCATGLQDGTLTIGDDIEITGARIKVDEADPGQGVFITDASGAEHRVGRRLTVNTRSRLMARVPADVPPGRVTVSVRTRYSGGSRPLASIRKVAWDVQCVAVRPE